MLAVSQKGHGQAATPLVYPHLVCDSTHTTYSQFHEGFELLTGSRVYSMRTS